MSNLDFGWAVRVLPRDAKLVEHMSVATVRALAIAVKCKATGAARSAGAVNERLSTHAIALEQDGPERVAAALPDSGAAASIPYRVQCNHRAVCHASRNGTDTARPASRCRVSWAGQGPVGLPPAVPARRAC